MTPRPPSPPSPRLVLASRSPRRRELLRAHGIDHDAIDPGIDDAELTDAGTDPAEWAMSLAHLKARAGLAKSPPGSIVLGADTVCILDGAVIGQPRDRAHARDILRSFVGVEHGVVTGVALVSSDWREIFCDRSLVRWGKIPGVEIEAYLDSEQWRGKAGAYNLAERLNAGWAIEYDGDPTSIMGLPMRALAPRLDRVLGTGAAP